MTPEEFRAARGVLGQRNLGRPYTMHEFGRILRLEGEHPGDSVRDYERGRTKISGPLSLAIDLMLTRV